MPFTNTKFEVSDPAFYDPLISDQKKEVRKDANNAVKWLELGRLQEAKVEMTKCFAEKSIMIRWLPVMTYVLFFITWSNFYFNPPPFFRALPWAFTLPTFIALAVFLIWMTFIRYPRSGSRYFRKVISLDPDCADAYMYLGRIALRRHQKKRGCFLLEQTMEAEEEQKEFARKNLSNLTLEIMEAKAKNERHSFEQSAKVVEDIMSSPVWQKLSDQARSCLATAEHAFSMLDKNSEDTDFSLVGMELCKALETEINKVLVRPFAKNINGCKEEFLRVNQTGTLNGRPQYFTYLAKVVDNINYPEVTGLSLGQYLFALKKTLDCEYAMDEYGNFLEYHIKSIGFGSTFMQNLKTVTNKYRNSIVHHTHMNIDQCEHLRELIFTGKNSLLVECCKISSRVGDLC